MDKACIYHFSANKKSKVCSKHIAEITEYANRDGYSIGHVYVDGSLKQSEKVQHTRMLQEAAEYDKLFVRDLFHLNKWTVKAMAYVKSLQSKGVITSSMHTGDIILESGQSKLLQPLKALFYHSKVNMADERKYETQKEIVELFCKEKTNWEIRDYIYEEFDRKSVDGQPRLWSLGDISDKYDLMIVQSFARLDLATARFEKVARNLNVPIYAMQEGLLTIKRKE